MSTCVTGICAPIGTPVPDPANQSPLLSPPADALPPDSSQPPPADALPPDSSQPPPADALPPVSAPPPPVDVLPPVSAPPPPVDVLPSDPPQPPPADVLPSDFSPPPPPDVLPPDSFPPPPADVLPSDPPQPPSSSTPLPPPPPAKASPSDSSSTPSPSQTSPPPPLAQQSSSKNTTRYTPSPLQSSPITVSPSSNSTSPSTGSSSVSMGVIAGVVFGGAAILIILGIFFVCCSRKKRKDKIGTEQYYMPPPQDGSSGGHMQHWQQNNPQSAEHQYMSSLPPPPGSAFRSPSQRLASRNSSLPPHSYSNGSGNFGGQSHGVSDNRGMGMSGSKTCFSYEELAMATNGFSNANFLGQGGFGFVHKGTLPNGKEVAIKSLKADSGQGDREFQAEIDVISRVHHKHLVSLVGYCCTGTQRMLVYEFVQNKTLEFHLFGKGRPSMDWPTRLKIALGSAKGLAYLHEDCHPKIIHRDIKTANILIDLQFEAKVADFGLAKFTEEANTHVSTRVMGTFGYLAPEYASSGKLTDKSDVFSFGVMLLELITGRPPVDRTNSYMEDSLVDWAEPLLARAMEDGNFEGFVDPNLQTNYNHDEMARMVACAAGATAHSAKRRPKMSQIVRALESSSSMSDLNGGVSGANGSPDHCSGQYKEDMKRFRKMVLQSQDTASTEYTTGTTSEYSMYSGSITDSSTAKEVGRSP